jgi:hypothetical protein
MKKIETDHLRSACDNHSFTLEHDPTQAKRKAREEERTQVEEQRILPKQRERRNRRRLNLFGPEISCDLDSVSNSDSATPPPIFSLLKSTSENSISSPGGG